MALSLPIVRAESSNEAVLDFSTVEQLNKVELANSQLGAKISYSPKNGSLVFEPNYTVNMELLFDFSQDSLKDYKFLKIRYYLNGSFEDGAYAYINDSDVKKELYKIGSGSWKEEIAEVGTLNADGGKIRFCPITSTGWSSTGYLYIDYIGLFKSESEAAAYEQKNEVKSDVLITDDMSVKHEDTQITLADDTFIQGYESRSFCPENPLSRAEAVTIAERLVKNKVKVPDDFSSKYGDLSSGEWYWQPAASLEIMGMLPFEGSFGGDMNISREEFAYLLQFFQSNNFLSEVEFTDVDRESKYYYAIRKAFSNGIVKGYPDGTFKPHGSLTRAEAVVMVMRLKNKNVSEIAGKTIFNDVSEDYWAAKYIAAATGEKSNSSSAPNAATLADTYGETFADTAMYDVYNQDNHVWEGVPLVTKEARELGSTGGEGGQICFGICYAQDGSLALSFTDTGGMFRSLDGGYNWEQAGRNIGGDFNGTGCGAIDPNNSSRAIVASHTTFGAGNWRWFCWDEFERRDELVFGGLHLTTDKAYSFKQVMRYAPYSPSNMGSVAYDSTSYDEKIDGSAVIYYSTPSKTGNNPFADKEVEEGINEGVGIYRSDDGGETWKLVNNGEQCTSAILAVSPKNGDLFIANKNGLFVSHDKGETVELVLDGMVKGLVTLVNKPDNVYISTYDGVKISTDGGKSFKSTSNSGFPIYDKNGVYSQMPGQLSVSPANPNYMLVTECYTGNKQQYYSHDGGNTWSLTAEDTSWNFYPSTQKVGFSAWHPTDENIVLKAEDWVQISEDGGRTFRKADGNLGSCINSRYKFNVFNPDLFFVPAQDYSGGFTTDGGYTFTRFANNKSHTYGAYMVDEQTFFVGKASEWNASSVEIQISRDAGNTYEATGVMTGTPYYQTVCLQAPGDPNVWFAGDMRSTDAGKTWTSMQPGCYFITDYNKDGGHELYGMTKDGRTCVMSKDNGATWETVFALPASIKDMPDYEDVNLRFEDAWWYMNDIAVDFENDIVYFTLGARAVYKYQDGKFVNLRDSIRKRCPYNSFTRVAVDKNHPEVIYLATDDNYVETGRFLLRSCDSGQSWQLLSSYVTDEDTLVKDGPMVGYRINSLEVNWKTGYVYVSSGDCGVYKFAPPYDIDGN